MRTKPHCLLLARCAEVRGNKAVATLIVVAALPVVLARASTREHAPARARLRAKCLARGEIAIGPAVTMGRASRHRGSVLQRDQQVDAHCRAAVHARYARSGESDRTALSDAHRIVRAVGVYRAKIECVYPCVGDPKIAEALGEIRVAREPLLAIRWKGLVLSDAAVSARRAFDTQGESVLQAEMLGAEHPEAAGAVCFAAARGDGSLAEKLKRQAAAQAESRAAQITRGLGLRLYGQIVRDAVAKERGAETFAVIAAIDSEVLAHPARLRAKVAESRLEQICAGEKVLHEHGFPAE